MIKSFIFNEFQENTHLLISPTSHAIIIDPGCFYFEERRILENFIDTHYLTPIHLLLTHAHLDHVLGNAWVFRKWGLRPQLHPMDLHDLERLEQTSAIFNLKAEPSPKPERFLDSSDKITWSGPEIQIFEAPGHSAGSLCFYIPDWKSLICGDVIFRGSIGRTDLPGGNLNTLMKSIRNLFAKLPEDTILIPGHGPTSTIAEELGSNPFLR